MNLVKFSSSTFTLGVALAVLFMIGMQGVAEYWIFKPLDRAQEVSHNDMQEQKAKFEVPLKIIPTSKTQLEDVIAKLSVVDNLTSRIELLHHTADLHGVAVRKAGYRTELLDRSIIRHEMTADLAGSYPDTRQYLRSLLAYDAAVAIEALEFNRPNAGIVNGTGAGSVRSQVRFALYSRTSPP